MQAIATLCTTRVSSRTIARARLVHTSVALPIGVRRKTINKGGEVFKLMNMFAYMMFIREKDPEPKKGAILIGAVKPAKVLSLS